MARSADFYLKKAEEFSASGEEDKAKIMRDAADSLKEQISEPAVVTAFAKDFPTDRTRDDYTPFGEVIQDVDHRTLKDNASWINASRNMYDMNKGEGKTKEEIFSSLSDFDGNTYEERMADYGLKQMAEFNFNLGKQALDTYQIHKASQRSKEAFVYMLDQYDEINTSWHTAGQAGWEMLTDVTNWLGLATLGTGAVLSTGAKIAGKEAIAAAVKNSIATNTTKLAMKTGITTSARRAGVTGAAWGSGSAVAYDSMKQNVRIDAGSQDEYDMSQTLLTGAFGLGAGALLGTGIDLGLSKLGSKFTQRQYNKILDSEKKIIQTQLDVDRARAAKIKRDLNRKPKENITKKDTDFIDNPTADPLTKVADGLAATGSQGFAKITMATARKRAAADEKAVGEITKKELVDTGADEIVRRVKTEPNGEKNIIKEFTTGHTTPAQDEVISETMAKAVYLIRGEQADAISLLQNKKLSKKDAKFLEGYITKLNDQELAVKNVYDSVFAYNGRKLQIAQKYGISSKDKKIEERKQAAIRVYKAELDSLEAKYSPLVNNAIKNNNWKEVEKLFRQHMAESDPVKARIGLNTPPEKLVDTKKITEQYVEASIAGVFSPSTVMVNMIYPSIKTATYPFIDNLVNSPLALDKWALTAKTYGIMFGQSKAAFQAAKVAFKDESTYLTMDTNRFLDGGIKIKGKVAGGARFFPRMLSATDAFNQELAAAGYLAGRAAEDLMREGIKKGFKGKRLKTYMDKNIKKKMDEGYDYNIGMDALKPLFAKAESLTPSKLVSKIKGETPEQYQARYNEAVIGYVMKQLRKDPNKLKQAMFGRDAGSFKRLKDADAIEYVEELLYKKAFKKEGAEGMFNFLEKAHRDFPILKIVGQLFFRTPVWVMHEAWRLTPAMNALLPNFRKDLAGHNGSWRQARAKTEANLAYAIMLWGTTKWAQGELSGSPDADWKKTAAQETSGLQDLNVMFGDTSIDYRKYEPFRIPLTMIANTLDSFIEVREKTAQDYFGEEDTNLLLQGFGVAMATTVSAFRDSALLTGVYDTMSAISRTTKAMTGDAEDRNEGWDMWNKYWQKKMTMPVPSVVKKVEVARGADQLTSIKTNKQRWTSLFDPNHISLPRKYDPIGVIRQVDNPAYALNPFVGSSKEQRQGRRTKKEQFVVDHLAELERLGYGNFSNHRTRVSWMEEDTREVYTNYKGYNITVFDAMMLEYAKLKPANTYYNILKNAGSLGRADKQAYYGRVVTELKQAQAAMKKKALDLVVNRDQKLKDKEVEFNIKKKEYRLFN